MIAKDDESGTSTVEDALLERAQKAEAEVETHQARCARYVEMLRYVYDELSDADVAAALACRAGIDELPLLERVQKAEAEVETLRARLATAHYALHGVTVMTAGFNTACDQE